MRFLRDQLDFLAAPGAFLRQLSADPRAAVAGFRNVLTIAVLYEIAILLWAFGADGVTLPAFMKIPEKRYYFYELIYLIPAFVVTWLLASAIGYVLSKALGGSGSFDAILGGFGVSMAVSAWFTLIPDYVQGILWTTQWIPFAEYQAITSRGILLFVVWAYMLAYTFSHLILYAMTIYHTQRISAAKAAIVSLVSYLGSFSVWITVVR